MRKKALKRRFAFVLSWVALGTALFATATAHGASLRGRLEEAQRLLRENKPGKALELYRDIQVEYPASEQALFGAACAQYQQGDGKLAVNVPEEAVTAFTEARAGFERLLGANDERIRVNAAFNRANCAAQLAKIAAANPQNYQQAVAALREAASAYEAVLNDFPDHAAAQQNLDHVRYLLKKMLQNPPEKQEEEKDEQKPPDGEQQKNMSLFTSARTDIAGAEARIADNTVELVEPAQGTQP